MSRIDKDSTYKLSNLFAKLTDTEELITKLSLPGDDDEDALDNFYIEKRRYESLGELVVELRLLPLVEELAITRIKNEILSLGGKVE